MKIMFAHSARFMRTLDGTVFSNSQFPYRRWERYLKHFDELVVICRMSECPDIPANWDVSSGARVVFAGTVDDHGNPLLQLQSGSARKIIKKQMNSCDAVIVRQSALGWLAAQEAQRMGTPWAVEVVGDAWDAYWYYGSLLGRLYAPIAWWQSRFWIGKSGFSIYVTREYLQRRFPCRGVCGNASNVQIAAVPESILQQRISRWDEKQPIPARTIVVGMIGSLFNRYKGLHIALRALQRLKVQGIFLQLRVLGNGKHEVWRKEAQQLGVDDLLHLDGCLPSGAPVMEWLDGLDIYIQPSFQEGLPRALIEAMSRGLPALGSTCGGIPELLSSECMHRPGDDKTLAEQLLKMLKEPIWRIQQSKRNFHEAQNYYSDRVEANRDDFWRQFAEYVRKY